MSLTNEVRIGNWVEILGDSKRLDFFTTIQPSSFSVNIDKTYGPIPLDEDWLQKFGFKLDLEISKNVYFKEYFYLEYPKDKVGYNFGWVGVLETAIKCKYVHQLQNLFFALTGSELQFNNDQPNL